MSQGLQVWDAAGNLVLDVTNRLTRIIGTVYSGESDGSIQVPEFATGDAWVCVQQANSFNSIGDATRLIKTTISGTTLSWAFVGPTDWPIQGGTLIYGLW